MRIATFAFLIAAAGPLAAQSPTNSYPAVTASVGDEPVRRNVSSEPVRMTVASDDDGYFQPTSAHHSDGCGQCASCATGMSGCVMGGQGRGIGLWGSVQFMHSWTKERTTPPLATTSPDNATLPEAGDLPGATVLFGGGYGGERQSGGLVDVGLWMNPTRSVGLGFRGFGLEGDNTSFFASSDGAGLPILARPYFDVMTGAEDAILSSFPGLFDGDIGISTSNEVYSAESYLRLMVARARFFELDLTLGYHFSRINDGIEINSQATVIDPGSPLFTGVFELTDSFATRNEFHGASVGFRSKITEGRATLRTLGKISYGNMHQRAYVRGETVATAFGVTETSPYGMLALPSNIGDYSRNVNCWVPEAGITLGYRLTRRWEMSAGYHLMYWSSFAGAADQIDRNLNLSQIPDPNLIVGAELPEFRFNDTDYWVQSITLGLNFQY